QHRHRRARPLHSRPPADAGDRGWSRTRGALPRQLRGLPAPEGGGGGSGRRARDQGGPRARRALVSDVPRRRIDPAALPRELHLRAMPGRGRARYGGPVVRTVLVSRRHLRLLVAIAAEEYVSPEGLAARLGPPPPPR